MSSEETREKVSRKRKRNLVAKHLMDRKGPYKIRTIHPKKCEYKRENFRVNDDFREEETEDF